MIRSLVFVFALISCSSAFAYIPPSEFIVKSWSQKHGHVKSVRTKTILFNLEGEKPGDAKVKVSTSYRNEDNTLRTTISDDAGVALYHHSETIESAVPCLLYCGFPIRLSSSLRKAGVPVKTEKELLALPTEEERIKGETAFLSRIKRQVAWVIGSKDSSQLWVEKDTFHPIKLKLDSYQVSFDGMKYYREFPFPRNTTFADKEGTAAFREELVDVTVNVTEHAAKVSTGFTEAGESASSSVRKLINEYIEKAR